MQNLPACESFRLTKITALLPIMSPSKPRSYCASNVSCFHISDSSCILINRASVYHSFRSKTMPSECVPQQFLSSQTPLRARILKKPFFSICTIARWFSVQCKNTPKHCHLSQRLAKTSSSRQWSRMHSTRSLTPRIALSAGMARKNTPTISQARLHKKREGTTLSQIKCTKIAHCDVFQSSNDFNAPSIACASTRHMPGKKKDDTV